MSSVLGASGDDAVTDALLESGERAAGATEWEDALIRHRIIPAPPAAGPTADDDLLLRAGAKGRKRGDDEDEEEDDDEEDDEALRAYRARRVSELKAAAARPSFSCLREIRADEFISEVTAASRRHPVVLLLTAATVPTCALLSLHLSRLSARFPHTSFLSCVASDCMAGFPDSRCPTLLVYRDGELQQQIVGMEELRGGGGGGAGGGGGSGCSEEEVEWRLAQARAVDGSRLQQLSQPPSARQRLSIRGKQRSGAAAGRAAGRAAATRSDDDDFDQQNQD